jgi:hypothetical protein
MFNKNNKSFKIVDEYAENLAVRCKIIKKTGAITNYLINIEEYDLGITVLLDKDGNPILSQVKL